ncbi:HAMP domain-containing sensor histidine kinase [Janibacter melonis]|uniref:HAMP domain-containing sensor histidine kinase n=1 Tax=Janibacter melonis TaxID=262209 RepID=UPI00209472F0|nr:HAMP domain-containing sensor histidine kinase [Janibacter melonis]
MDRREPLAGVTSIRTRLAVLVGASVVVAALVGALGTDVGVPLWISLPVTIALALVVTRWLATGMTTPLREMTAAASRVAAGDYDVRVTDSGTAEIGALSRALSSMAHDLGAADEHRRRLVATVAHELRTPLAAQQALLENLVDGVTAPDDAALQQALHQSERLGALVADLLDLSRDDGRGAPMTPQRLPVRELLDRAVGEAALQSRSVELVARVDPEDLVVTADRGRLQQVLANLVDNALRHSPEAGTVTLRAALAGPDHWSLTVEDEGPGLAPDRAERLFDRFGSGGDAAGGTGLGLAIVGWVAAMHGGRVEALPPREGSSPAPGCG